MRAQLVRMQTMSDLQKWMAGMLRQVTHYGPIRPCKMEKHIPLVPGLVTGRAILNIEQFILRIYSNYPKQNFQIALHSKNAGTSHHACDPYCAKGNAIGAIVVRRNEVRPFTQKQISLLRNICRSSRHRHRKCASLQ